MCVIYLALIMECEFIGQHSPPPRSGRRSSSHIWTTRDHSASLRSCERLLLPRIFTHLNWNIWPWIPRRIQELQDQKVETHNTTQVHRSTETLLSTCLHHTELLLVSVLHFICSWINWRHLNILFVLFKLFFSWQHRSDILLSKQQTSQTKWAS